MHLVVGYGYEGANHDSDVIARTGLLFDAVLVRWWRLLEVSLS